MKLKTILYALAVVSAAAVVADTASAGEFWGRWRAQRYAWHGAYYHTAWGTPVALVVPPTAQYQTDWGWGVGTTRISPVDHQFRRPWPGPYYGGPGFLPTPHWPSDTRQFGVYNVRAPW